MDKLVITLCNPAVLWRDVDVYFRPEFLEWCDDWGSNFELVEVFDPGTRFDIEVHGLSEADEALWLLRWGKSDKEYPFPLPDDCMHVGREMITRPYADFKL